MKNPMNFRKTGMILLIVGLTLACNLPRPSEIAPTDTPGLETPATTSPFPSLEPIIAPQLRSFVMRNRLDGWALGENVLVRTEDGGATWGNATPPGLAAGFGASASLAALDADHAWLLVALDYPTSGMLYRTVNGGRTWTAVPVPFSGGDMEFLDASHGWIMADLGAGAGSQAVAIFQTSDGGATWTQVYVNDPTLSGASDTLPLSGIKSGLGLLDSQHAWVGGSVPMDGFVYLYASEDGGRTWAHQAVTLPAGYETAQTVVNAPRFFAPQQGVFAATLYTDEITILFYISTDGGRTWQPTSPLPVSGLVSIASATDLWVWDGGPNMHFSPDGGRTWESRTTDVNLKDTLAAFQFVDADYGWALTLDLSGHSALYRTTDGGRHWTALIP